MADKDDEVERLQEELEQEQGAVEELRRNVENLRETEITLRELANQSHAQVRKIYFTCLICC